MKEYNNIRDVTIYSMYLFIHTNYKANFQHKIQLVVCSCSWMSQVSVSNRLQTK